MTKIMFIIIGVLLVTGAGVAAVLLQQGAAQSGMTGNNAAMLGNGNTASVVSADVDYFDGTKGFLAYPASGSPEAGVVMIHEWWGLNDNIKNMAKMLAGEGYAVLAVDLYHGEVAADSTRAQQLSSSLNQEEANRNLSAAAQYLRENRNVSKVISLGWCFGGGQSLQMALSGEKLDGTIIYYGRLTSDTDQLSKITWPVLGIFGGADQSIPVSEVEGFRNALNTLGITNEIVIYPGVGHAFANPSGASYAPNETKDAWAKTLAFLKENA